MNYLLCFFAFIICILLIVLIDIHQTNVCLNNGGHFTQISDVCVDKDGKPI